MKRYAQYFNTLPVRPSIWRKLNREGTQKLSNLSAIWLLFPSQFYGREVWKSERLSSLFKTLQVQSGRVELGTQNVWLQSPDSSTVGCSLSLVLGWWSQSLKLTKPGFKSWLCHFPSWWQQASDNSRQFCKRKWKTWYVLIRLSWWSMNFIYTKVIIVHRAMLGNTYSV